MMEQFIDESEIEIIQDHLIIEFLEPFLDKMERFNQMPRFVQKSKGWRLQRHEYLTASIISDVLGTAPSGQRNLLIEKVSPEQFKGFHGSRSTQWGVCYEPVANAIYNHRSGVIKIWDFGLITNDKYPCLAVSPDGITERGLLEIKCPYSRDINGKISKKYQDQMQMQMAVCEFSLCDFLECKFTELTENDFFEQLNDHREHPEQGLIIEYTQIIDGEDQINYWYSPLDLAQDPIELKRWQEDRLQDLLEYPQCVYNETHYWHLEIYKVQTVVQDPDWIILNYPKFQEFWDKVLYCRTLTSDQFTEYLENMDKVNPVRKRSPRKLIKAPNQCCL